MKLRTWSGGSVDWTASNSQAVVKPRRKKRPSLRDDVVAGRVAREKSGDDAMKRGSVSSMAGLLPPSATRKLELVKKRGEGDFGIMLTGDRPAIFTNIATRSAASRAGLHVGDVLLEVNGRSVEGDGHTDIVQSIGRCKKTVTFVVVDDETYRLGMSLSGFSSSTTATAPPASATVMPRRDTDASPARSVSAASSLASRSSLASQSDNDSGKSPTRTAGSAVSSSPTMSAHSAVSQDSTVYVTPPNAMSALRNFLDAEETTRYDGKRRSNSHQSVTWDQRNRFTSMSGGGTSATRSALAKSKSFSQSEGSITRSGRPTSMRNTHTVAFTLTEDVVVGPPTETHRVAGGSLLQHYDFDVLYYGEVPLSSLTTQSGEPKALTEMSAEAVRRLGDENAAASAKPAVLQVSSSGLCLIEKTDEKRRMQVDPVFIPRAHLSAAWCSRQSPHYVALLQRSNPWSISPSSPLHQTIKQQQSDAMKSSPSEHDEINESAAAATSSSSSISGSTAASYTAQNSARQVLVVNAHVVLFDSSKRSQHMQASRASSKPTSKIVSPLNGQEQRPSGEQSFAQAQSVVSLLSSLFDGSQDSAAAVHDTANATRRLSFQPAAGHCASQSIEESTETRLSPSPTPDSDSSDPLNLVDAQGSVSFLGLQTLTSRPSQSEERLTITVEASAADRRCSSGVACGECSLHPAVIFDWRSAFQSSSNSNSVGATAREQDEEQAKEHSSEDEGNNLTFTQDLADEKFAALNLSSTGVASRSKSKKGKVSMDSLKKGTSQHGQRVSSWAASIRNLLEDKAGVDLFMDYLKEILAPESLMFYLQMKDFKALTDAGDIKKESERLYGTFISNDGDLQLNLTDECYQEVASRRSSPNLDMFDGALREAFLLMSTDPYPAFLRTKIVQDWMTLEVSGDPLPCDTAAERTTKATQKKRRLISLRSSKKSAKTESAVSLTAEDIHSRQPKAGTSSKWLQADKVNTAVSEGRLNRTPQTSPQHPAVHSVMDLPPLSPAGSEKSIVSAVSGVTGSPSSGHKKDRSKSGRSKYSFFHKKDKPSPHPDIHLNLPSSSYIFDDSIKLDDMEDDEVLLRVTFAERLGGVVRRKKTSSIREAIEPVCERAGFTSQCVAVYEQVSSIEREVDLAMQVGSLQGTQIRILPLPSIKLHLPNNSVERLVIPEGNKKTVAGLVDEFLQQYGLSFMSEAVGATNLSGDRVHPFDDPLRYANATIVLNFDASIMETNRVRRSSDDSAISASAFSVASIQSASPIKSPGRVRSSSFRKAGSPFRRRSTRISPSASPAPTSRNRFSLMSDEGDSSRRRNESPGRSSMDSVPRLQGHRESRLSPTNPTVSPDSENALFDLLVKSQAGSMEGQRATLNVGGGARGTVPAGPGITPPLDPQHMFHFDASGAPRAAVDEILKNRMPTPEDHLVARRMSASPQTYRHRPGVKSGFRGSSGSLDLSKNSTDLNGSIESLTGGKASLSGSKRLLKNLSRSMSKLSTSTPDIPLNASLLAHMLHDGDRAEAASRGSDASHTPGVGDSDGASPAPPATDATTVTATDTSRQQQQLAAEKAVADALRATADREAKASSTLALSELRGVGRGASALSQSQPRYESPTAERTPRKSSVSSRSSSRVKLNSSSSSSDEDQPRTGKKLRVDYV